MKLHGTKSLIAIGMLGAASLALIGCTATSNAATQTTDQSASTEQTEARGPMGVSGEIAVVSDSLLQVQDSDSQTAVSFTDATTITQQVEASLADVTEGVCVTATGGGDDESTAVTSIRITEPTDGECAIGGGMQGGMQGGSPGEMPEGFTPPTDGEMPEGAQEDMPEGMEPPSGDMPEGMPEGGAGGFGGLTSGLVTAVSGSTITVETTSMDGEQTEQEVTVDDSTTYTKTVDASADALEVGACVVAMGEYEGETYAATALALSEAGEDGCNTGFGGGGGFPGGRDNNA